MKRELICVLCPRGCRITAEISGDTVTAQGNACPNGEKYAKSECIHPVRTLTATVRVANRKDTMVSVKTDVPVAKDKMLIVMQILREMTVNAPISVGQVLIRSICGSNIVATKDVN